MCICSYEYTRYIPPSLPYRYVTSALSLIKSPDASEISRYQRKVVKLLQSALDEQFKEVSMCIGVGDVNCDYGSACTCTEVSVDTS